MIDSIFIDGDANGGLFSYVSVTSPISISTYNSSLCAVIALSPSAGTLQVYRPNAPLNPFTHFLPNSGYIVLSHKPFQLKYLNISKKSTDFDRLDGVAIDSDGSHICAVTNVISVNTVDGGLNWSVGGAPNQWQDFYNLDINGDGSVALLTGPSTVEKSEGVNVYKKWEKVNFPEPLKPYSSLSYGVLDGSGTKFTVACQLTNDSGKYIYTSDNSGDSWTKTSMANFCAVHPMNVSNPLAADHSGNIILSVSGTNILMSSNRGASYNVLSPTSGVYWSEVKISSNGQEKIVAGFQGTTNPSDAQGLVMLRASLNNSWKVISTPEALRAFDCDASGTKIVAVNASQTQIWVSDDRGETWTRVGPLMNNRKERVIGGLNPTIKISKNGKCITTILTYASQTHGYYGGSQIAVSKDFGATWSFYPPKGTFYDLRDFRAANNNEFFAAYSQDDFLCSVGWQKMISVNNPTKLQFNPALSAVPINLSNYNPILNFEVTSNLPGTSNHYILVTPGHNSNYSPSLPPPEPVYTPGYYNDSNKTITWLSGGSITGSNSNLQKFIMSPLGTNVIGVNYVGEIYEGTTASILPFQNYTWSYKKRLPFYETSINTFCIAGGYGNYGTGETAQNIYIGAYNSSNYNFGAIYVSNDYGQNWTELQSTKNKAWNDISMTVNPSGGYTVFAAARNDTRLYRAFTPNTVGVVPNEFVPVGPQFVDYTNWSIDNYWALATISSNSGPTLKLFFSSDNFETWQERPLPFDNFSYGKIFCPKNNGHTCYFITPGHVYKTTTTNASWDEVFLN